MPTKTCKSAKSATSGTGDHNTRRADPGRNDRTPYTRHGNYTTTTAGETTDEGSTVYTTREQRRLALRRGKRHRMGMKYESCTVCQTGEMYNNLNIGEYI